MSSWVPLGDVAPDQGSLFVLQGSHRMEQRCDITDKFPGQAEVGAAVLNLNVL